MTDARFTVAADGTATDTEPTPAQIREWLRANRRDIKVGERGRLSAEAYEAYRQQH